MIHLLSSSLHHEELSLPFQLPEAFLQSNQVVAVLTGGTENRFVELVNEGLIDLRKPVYLMVSGQSNSLAASLEILSYIRQHNGIGKVMDKGQSNDVQSTKESVTGVPSEALLESDKPLRLGVIGSPSDWLIASKVDYADVLKNMNITHLRLKEIVQRYDLQGVTLRCFDLLTTVKNTGCIALSKLNDEGIPAACEGDIPTLLTMMLCKRLTNEPCFQVNPARIQQDGLMLFAHCTLPLRMTEKHEYTTHFESGIGVAIHGDLPTGDYTLVKLSRDMTRLLAEDVKLIRCQFEPNLCRTQVWIQSTPAVSRYFFNDPIANHHVLIRGHHAAKFKKE